ncbi:MAG: hypothetical protein M3Q82_09310, partial [Actinomycetota bacterium]|nr:hypothetical protein [Actinomycetota bacterium]
MRGHIGHTTVGLTADIALADQLDLVGRPHHVIVSDIGGVLVRGMDLGRGVDDLVIGAAFAGALGYVAPGRRLLFIRYLSGGKAG